MFSASALICSEVFWGRRWMLSFKNGGRLGRRLKVKAGAPPLQSHLVKVSDDFVEQPQALHSLVVHLGLGIKVGEARDGCEHHAHGVVGLRVQLL